MSERKVLNKYYPADFDPSKIPRRPKKKKQNDVRTMAPFNMKCIKCNEYIATGTKFNAKKEVFEDAKYNNISIYRFFIRCPRCSNRIIYRTDPRERNYEVEEGATENFRALKLAEREEQETKEAEEEEEKINPMKHLENRTKASLLQMEKSEQIQNIRSIKDRFNRVDLDKLIRDKRCERDSETIDSIAGQVELKMLPPPPLPHAATSIATMTAIEKSTKRPINSVIVPKKTSSSFSKISSSLSSIKKINTKKKK